MPQHLSNTKKMMMNVSKNKAFLIAGIAVLGLGVGAYFLFFHKKKEHTTLTTLTLMLTQLLLPIIAIS